MGAVENWFTWFDSKDSELLTATKRLNYRKCEPFFSKSWKSQQIVVQISVSSSQFPCILLVGAKSRKPQPVGLPVLIYPCQNWSPMRVTSVNHSNSVTPKRKLLVVTFVSQILKMSRNIQDTQILRVGEIKFTVSVIPSTELRWFSLQHGSHDNFVDFGQWVAYRVLPKDRKRKTRRWQDMHPSWRICCEYISICDKCIYYIYMQIYVNKSGLHDVFLY